MVICPAQLRDMWRVELYDANIQADVHSQEELGQKDYPVERYQDVDIVLVDESHNFRNTAIKRYKNLERILGAGSRKKLVLMTATPINNTLLNLYHQINLISRGDDYHFRAAGIGNLKTYFVNAAKGLSNLFNLLEEVVIRRTRHYVKENFPEATINGKPVKFPERTLHIVRYDLRSTYNNIYEEIVGLINKLNLTPYNIEQYKKDKSKKDEEDTMRNQALIGLIKTLFLNRFESSIYAFQKSINNQLGFQQAISEDTKARRAATLAPKRLDKVQSDLIAILREGVSFRKVDKATAYDIVQTLNLPMTSAFINDLKAVRELFNKEKNYFELQESLRVFSGQFELSAETEGENEIESKIYSPEDLELVCYLTLS